MSTVQPPRTLLSSIQKVRVENYSNHRSAADILDVFNNKRPPDEVIDFTSDLYSNKSDCVPTCLNGITREHNNWTLLNPLATECLFFHQEMNRDQDGTSSSKWATTSRKLKVSAKGR